MTKAQQDIKKKLKILNHAKVTGNVSKTLPVFWNLQKHFLRVEMCLCLAWRRRTYKQ